MGVRPILVPSNSCHGSTDSRSMETLPISGGKHPTVPEPRRVQADDTECGIRICYLRESDVRCSCYSLGIQTVTSGLENNVFVTIKTSARNETQSKSLASQFIQCDHKAQQQPFIFLTV
uniref:Uncharacterized protein n=1 Tax=Cacopsylla melanoneura TaxID=428564 RepID=A0A8D8QD64_9HEMI